MASRPPSPSSEAAPCADPLQSLPHELAVSILQEAGPHTRQVCHAYHALHPPLLALAPDELPTPDAAQATIARLPRTLTSLDLTGPARTSSCGPNPITADVLATIPATLPRLQQLMLPAVPDALLPTVSDTLQACPHLHTLSISWETRCGYPWDPNPWGPLLHHPTLTRLRSVTLPGAALPALAALSPGSLPHLTSAMFSYHGCLATFHLALLAAAAPALQSVTTWGDLSLDDRYYYDEDDEDNTHHLTKLTALTALACYDVASDVSPNHLPQDLGALTGLRSLCLSCWDRSWAPTDTAWLPRLSLLTRLDISLFDTWWTVEEAAFFTTAVAANAARLPQLRSLHLASSGLEEPECLACGQPNSFYRHLAAATQLQRLSLHHLDLPVEDASLLSSLQGLTSLELYVCYLLHVPQAAEGAAVLGPHPFQWVSALSSLQDVTWDVAGGDDVDDVGVRQYGAVLCTLPRLHTLALGFRAHGTVCSPELPALLAALAGQLKHLRLEVTAYNDDGGNGVLMPSDLLVSLTRLEVADLSGLRTMVKPQQLPQLPASVRRCYAPVYSRHDGDDWRAVVQQLRARYPLVAVRGVYKEARTV